MKNYCNKIVLTIVSVLSTLSTFAQGPDPDNLPGDLNPTDAPINNYIVLLALVAICFAFYSFKQFKKAV
jgi:hypothetical protein